MPLQHKKSLPALATLLLACAGVASLATSTQAACLSNAQVAQLAQHYLEKTPAPNPPALSDADGKCSRTKLNALLAPRLGKVVGYKAGLTNPAVQKRFQTDQPVWGTLYASMLHPNGFTVEATFGARPLYEADMLVRVTSAAIHQARSPIEVLAHIDQIIPFIELPDLVVQAPQQLNGAGVTAINVGARLGVVGQPIAVPPLRGERYQLLAALERMQVHLTNAQGQLLTPSGQGSDILGQPLNAVVWIVQALEQEGITLEPGQFISLGSFSALLSPRPGLSVTATYEGLSGAQPVQVHFK